MHVAETGETALELLRREGHSIDWLLTDINLPGLINGWVVGAEFHLTHPLRPVLYTSAFAPRQAAQPAGGVYVSKPYSLAMIADVIRTLSGQGDQDDDRPLVVRLAELMSTGAA